SIVRQVCNFQTTRDDHYASPIVRGMARHGIKKRERILKDHELALVWRKADGLFGNFTKLAFLTGQRREKLATMQWADIEDGVWHVPNGTGEKGAGGELELPKIASAILEDQRKVNLEGIALVGPLHIDTENPYVFAGRGMTHFSGFSKRKRALDAKLKISD